MDLGLTGLSGGYLASLAPSYRQLRSALIRPQEVQRARLLNYLRQNRDTAFGAHFGFGRIRSIGAYQARIPIADYEQMRPWIARIAEGEQRVLTEAPVIMMERSSGSTGGDKLIPYTQELLDEFAQATNPWIFSLYLNRPSLLGTRSYWSISPAARASERTPGGLPIGFVDDAEYFGPAARWAIRRMMSVPSAVAQIQDIDNWRHATAQHLLRDSMLGLISVWNPSFLTLLMQHIERARPLHQAQLPRHRARLLEGADWPQKLWPKLSLISCWTDGRAQDALRALRRYFPRIEIQGKGLLATEGVISTPVQKLGRPEQPGAALAVGSHFLEFIPQSDPQGRPHLAHALEPSERYAPLLTTAGGLYRYRLGDEVVCTGRLHNTPTIRFLGKLDQSCDLRGEKLTAAQVERGLVEVCEKLELQPNFTLLTPYKDDEEMGYRLYVQGVDAAVLPALASALEDALMRSYHYRYCRELGQLRAVQAQLVERAAQKFEAAMLARGVRAGDIKPTQLDPQMGWAQVFQ